MKITEKLPVPKSQNRFKIVFKNFGTNTNDEELFKNVFKCTNPSIGMGFDLRKFGFMLNPEPKWDDIKLILRDDVENIVHTEVLNELNTQFKDAEKVFSLKLISLDNEGNTLSEMSLSNCRISKYSTNDWDYSKSSVKTITLYISYEMN